MQKHKIARVARAIEHALESMQWLGSGGGAEVRELKKRVNGNLRAALRDAREMVERQAADDFEAQKRAWDADRVKPAS